MKFYKDLHSEVPCDNHSIHSQMSEEVCVARWPYDSSVIKGNSSGFKWLSKKTFSHCINKSFSFQPIGCKGLQFTQLLFVWYLSYQVMLDFAIGATLLRSDSHLPAVYIIIFNHFVSLQQSGSINGQCLI